jgi:hypothetical protein
MTRIHRKQWDFLVDVFVSNSVAVLSTLITTTMENWKTRTLQRKLLLVSRCRGSPS